MKKGDKIKYLGGDTDLESYGFIIGGTYVAEEIVINGIEHMVVRANSHTPNTGHTLVKNGVYTKNGSYFEILKTIFSVGDTIGVKPEYDKTGQHINARGMIRAIDATKYYVVWSSVVWSSVVWSSDPNGIMVDYQHHEVDTMAYLIHKQDAPSSGGPHNCADHLVFCQGFRFDYHFCKVCGTKQNVA